MVRTRLSVERFCQFFLRAPDSHVGGYLKMFTLLPLPRIEAALAHHAQNPEARAAQRLLAGEVTELIHGGAQRAFCARGGPR